MQAKTKKIGRLLSGLICLLIVVYYSVLAYSGLPTKEQERVYYWIKQNQKKLIDPESDLPVELSVVMLSPTATKKWVLERTPSDKSNSAYLNRLLELAVESELFLVSNGHSKYGSEVTIKIGQESFTSRLDQKTIGNSPALQNFLQLARIYSVAQDENKNARLQ